MKSFAILLLFPLAVHAGGSNYGIKPGAHPEFAGKVSEWAVPTPKFARDPAPAPDGSIFIAVMSGNKVARFDPKAKTFREWDLPSGHRPHGLLVDKQAIVWTTGNGNGSIGRLDPATGRITEFKTPSGGGGPHTLVITSDGGTLWFTMQSGDKVASLDTRTGAIKEYATSGGPYGIALDQAGNVWFCRMGDDKMGKLDPKTGRMSEVATGRGSRPRRVAISPDGMLWIALYGNGRLAKLDPAAMKVVKEYRLPGGNAGPYAVTTDGGGIVWVNEINTDTVVRLDPKTEQMRVVKLPTSGAGIRKMIVDSEGKLWYMGSHNGRLGVVE
ncbi:MAG: PQQ-binding-like beta-propeller repeat protein [Betaproteobacteria bacterium]|nr:PQQ-binding-like beta-propeller repeat protein [Betaproteobacteria bacterium]